MTSIRRLTPDDAQAIAACFRRVYGDTYANGLFYDAAALADAMREGVLGSVGAFDEAGNLLGHMAMTVQPAAAVVELGNTVVDPAARGKGLAWKVGAELSAWCRDLAYQGFVHYPTTDHHIMQRQSVKAGFETGLMLGYVPSETHGRVGDRGSSRGNSRGSSRRKAATIVYEPYTPGAPFEGYLPVAYEGLLAELIAPTGLPRRWSTSTAAAGGEGDVQSRQFHKRGLTRLAVEAVGDSFGPALEALDASESPCLQIDFSLGDPAVGAGVRSAQASGFRFCGWLPGFRRTDILRMQRVDESVTDLAPGLENPMAQKLLEVYLAEGAGSFQSVPDGQ